MKDAQDFGFDPANDGESNSVALQKAVEGGGTVLINLPGKYDVCDTCVLGSNTHLIFGKDVFLNRVKDSNGKTASYPFINRGAYSEQEDQNISIEGLHLITNGLGMGTNGTKLLGQRGQIAFSNVRDLCIKDFEILDGTDPGNYNIHIQNFKNISLEEITIVSQKDGIHLGAGKGFSIKHCTFLTNDDAIALNAHDYPSGTSYFGWIEDGIIDDIHFLDSEQYRSGRGIYMLGGSWDDWKEGNEYRTRGDAVISGGRLYRTVGAPATAPLPTLVSKDKPMHTSGIKQYPDGLSWLMMQDKNVSYNCGIRNIIVKNVFVERRSRAVITMNFDDGPQSRSVYPGSKLPCYENITIENVFSKKGKIDRLLNISVPVQNIRVFNVTHNYISCLAEFGGSFVPFDLNTAVISFYNCFFELNSVNSRVIKTRDNRAVTFDFVDCSGSVAP